MLLRTRLSMLAAGVVACCATATAVLPTQAFAAPPAATAATAVPAPAATSAGPVGLTAPTVTTGSEDLAKPAAALTPALIGATRLDDPAGASAPATFKSLAVQSCTPADFAARTGADLVAFVKSSTVDCVKSLYSSGSADPSIFQQSRMLSVAAALKDLAAGYAGDNSTGITQLVKYLQVGYYIQFYNPDRTGPYTGELTTAVTSALDTLFAGTRWRDVSDSNGSLLKEVVWLTDSANVQARYIGAYKRILDEYNNTYNAFPQMISAVNSVLFYPLWGGYRNQDFVRALAADPGLVASLADFAIKHRDLLSGPQAVLDTNAGNDLARFAGTSPAAEAVAKPLVKKVLDSAPLLTPFGSLYVYTAVQAAYYNNGQCSYYGICDLPAKLTSVVLPNQLVCDNRTIQAQALSAAELQAACTSLRGEDTFFHNVVKDNGPIPNQYAKTVTLGIFANKADYTTYSWAIYGNSTDNGGQTVMDPTDPNRRAVNVMYQKAWNTKDTARVWNLNHEYSHYLDGIYDMKGNFSTQTSVPDIWWVEGFAEYMSYSYRATTDTDAMTQAGLHTYKLSTVFQNTYANSDSTRVYPWGYLAVRYMLEKHPADVQAMLARFRVGDYTGGYAVYNNLGTSYDADFDAWLTACAAGACYAAGPTSLFDTTVNGATVNVSERSVQTGPGRITAWHWTFGDGTTSEERNPSHTYALAGSYTVALTTTDDTGRTAVTPATVTVTAPATSLAPCTEQRNDAMGLNCSRSGRAATAGNSDYLYVYLPAGTTTLKVSTTGGTGTAYLYYNADTWASPTAWTAASTAAGATQSITVTNPTAGYRYLSLYAVTDFSGVTVTTQV
ncbi:collagenase [Kitasatospora purpeofusca]|uniref:collagenase n=1 Tax=Kitasatospora purpeofusca TaxID=67352 RepID=UPI002252F0C4|nr:collagenase [Kitasatospora purpeofusca]MCX4753445.1 collagenase [Kitasatospora purpeofusca]WSR32942.1 collagenase [Kitasatospora purpeofusca]WSR41036.1 collagenase [Kitasatospora purpeofusca]